MLVGYRKKMKKTQKDFAKILNITSHNYSLKETGKRPFKDSEKVVLKNYINKELNLNLTIDELFF